VDDTRLGWVFDKTVQATTEALDGKGMDCKYGDIAMNAIDNNNHEWADNPLYFEIAEAVL